MISAAFARSSPTTARLRELNDQFRQSFVGGRVVLTAGVAALSPDAVADVVERVKTFNGFDADNDPHGEHDFGALQIDGAQIFWKIDCYDRSLQSHSPDASDAAVTTRVLTVMLAEEY